MARSISELEQKLLDKGFKLSHKTYQGKHSQYVNEYVYVGKVFCELNNGDNYNIETKIVLNSKKDKINSIFVRQFCNDFINEGYINELKECMSFVNKYVCGE